jgi:ClpP class serine protease
MSSPGGYYLSMAASKIVAERLTITGSIGVITGKFSLEELYGKVGYAKELISKGRCVYTSSQWKSSPTLPCKDGAANKKRIHKWGGLGIGVQLHP